MRIKSFELFVNESATKNFHDLVHENTYTLDDVVYHGSPLPSFYSILQSGLYGYSHREMSEDSIVCTSLNDSAIRQFSDENNCGICYHPTGAKIFILPEWLRAMLDDQSGASTYGEYKEEDLKAHCAEYNIPYIERWGDAVRLPYGFLEKNLPQGYSGVMYEYTAAGNYKYGDEAEITFMGPGIDLLNRSIYTVYINGTEFDTAEDALEYLRENFSEEELGGDSEDDYEEDED